jgi:signal transduction histidine kinase/ligand-binding sensor domain-containing protein/DNA-binding response OmpR family regulator
MLLLNKKITSIILIIYCCFNLTAQVKELYFDKINYDEGFSPSMISGMIQSKKGFVWIGTENGLFRYDGYNFNRYTRDKKVEGSLSNSHINVIFEDSEENLWIGTNNGLNFYKKNSNSFVAIDLNEEIKGGKNYISSFVEDDQKTVWVGTFGGLKKINKKSNSLENVSTDLNFILNQSRVLSLFYDKEYGLIVGASKGIQCYDISTSTLKKLPNVFYENPEFLTAKIWKTVKTSNGDLWFGTETKGAFFYSKQNNTLTQYKNEYTNPNSISSNWINDITIIDKNTIWFATKEGLSVFNKSKNNFKRYKHSPLNNSTLTDNDIKCFLTDKSGSIWLGTSAGEINFYNKSNSNFIKITETFKPNFGLNNAIVNAVLNDENALWVGTYGGGLNHLDFKNKTSNSYIIEKEDQKKTKNIITSIIKKDEETILCGTFNGLFEFNKKTKKFKQIPLSKNGEIENERPITSLLLDNEDIWVGTNGNGIKRILKNGTIENYVNDGSLNSISDNFIMDIENRKNGLWISTQDGLNYFDKKSKKVKKIYRSNQENSIDNNSLTVLFTDSKNRLWIGADFDGLYCLDENANSFFILNKSNGLTDATIKSISEDNQGNLWVSVEDFLFEIKIKSDAKKLTLSDVEITKYTEKDGVSSKQFSYNCSTKLNENKLVFGASKGLLIFNPKNVIKAVNKNDIVFTKLIINNEIIESGHKNGILKNAISETTEITINYDQGYVGLEFSNLNFISPKKSNYAYKLDNSFKDDDWHNTGTQNRINLANLNSGTYLLSIKSSNEDGSWNPKIKTLQINILPPWWRTWWAYCIYILFVLITSYFIYQFIKNKIRLKRELFLEHVENERKQEMFNMQLNFFTNISHEIRTPLTLIKGPVEELLYATENNPKTVHKLKTIQQNSDRLLKLVNELLDFRKAEKGHMKLYCEKQDLISFCFDIYESFKGVAAEKNIEYKFVLDTNTIPVYFDKNQMEKVIFNLLSNAFKFTKKNGKIVFAVEQRSTSENKVFIKIKDNGIGIPENSKNNIFTRFFQVDDRGVNNVGSGVGLALAKNIVELHKGEISIPDEKESWANTVFQIELQLGNKHLTKEQIIESDDDNLNIKSIESENNEYTEDTFENAEIEEISDKKTILIVEDNDEVRKFIYDILEEDYHVVDFCNGREALAFMDTEIPDLIVSDVMMPEMNGLEFCKHIKTNESTNHIPVILLTAKASTDNKIEGLTTGADAYISKPFNIQILKLSILNLLSSKEILRLKYSGNFIIDSDLNKLTTPEDIFIKKLMKIIEQNLEKPDFDVNMLVREIGMSRTILYKKVNTLTNHSVASLIKYIRLKKAADIILKTTHPISEIAFLVGFNDRKHFSKEFKKVYKVSPTEYKNSKNNSE